MTYRRAIINAVSYSMINLTDREEICIYISLRSLALCLILGAISVILKVCGVLFISFLLAKASAILFLVFAIHMIVFNALS